MATEDKSTARGTIGTVVATAAITLAIGVTGAALGGYLVPIGDRAIAPPVEPTTAPTTTEAPPQTPSPTSPPSVVLVPVAPDARAEPVVTLAAYEPTDYGYDDDDHEGDDERDHEDEDDDD